jgi:hypothetical protein
MRSTRLAAVATTAAGLVLASCGGGRIAVERAGGAESCTEERALAVFGAGDGFTSSHGLTVCANGRVDLHYSRRVIIGPLEEARLGYEIDRSDVQRIEDALADAEFSSLERRYVSQAADVQAYSLTTPGRPVYADQVAIDEGDVPDRLVDLISLFESLLDPAVRDAEGWLREEPALVLRYKEERAREALARCRSTTTRDPRVRLRDLERLEDLAENGVTRDEADEVDALVRMAVLC